jgi:hypothetical protein
MAGQSPGFVHQSSMGFDYVRRQPIEAGLEAKSRLSYFRCAQAKASFPFIS